jgi:hypothetical protein
LLGVISTQWCLKHTSAAAVSTKDGLPVGRRIYNGPCLIGGMQCVSTDEKINIACHVIASNMEVPASGNREGESDAPLVSGSIPIRTAVDLYPGGLKPLASGAIGDNSEGALASHAQDDFESGSFWLRQLATIEQRPQLATGYGATDFWRSASTLPVAGRRRGIAPRRAKSLAGRDWGGRLRMRA